MGSGNPEVSKESGDVTWALKDKKEWRTGKEESPGAAGLDLGSPDGHDGGCGGEWERWSWSVFGVGRRSSRQRRGQCKEGWRGLRTAGW